MEKPDYHEEIEDANLVSSDVYLREFLTWVLLILALPLALLYWTFVDPRFSGIVRMAIAAFVIVVAFLMNVAVHAFEHSTHLFLYKDRLELLTRSPYFYRKKTFTWNFEDIAGCDVCDGNVKDNIKGFLLYRFFPRQHVKDLRERCIRIRMNGGISYLIQTRNPETVAAIVNGGAGK